MSSIRSCLTMSVRHLLRRTYFNNASLQSHARHARSLRTCISGSRVFASAILQPSIIPHKNIHTAGDKELLEFLKDEIKIEKKTLGKLPTIKGFEVASSDGPNVTLKKTLENESVTIKFSVNNSVDDTAHDIEADAQQSEQQQETQDAKMVSKPSFIVEINKGGNQTLAIQCVFPPADDYRHEQEQEQDAYEDLIEIQDVALLGKSQEWNDDVYSLSASVMDGNLYDMLMKMLEERGIDADFVDQLVEFCTSYEHSKYVDTLEKLKNFVDAK